MRRLLLSFTVLTALTAALAAAGLAPVASGQALSEGCAFLNESRYDGFYLQSIVDGQFAAGDHVTVTAGPPTSFGSPTEIRLGIDGTLVDSAAFPGTVEYTFPSAGEHSVRWLVANMIFVTWTVSCQAAFDPEQAIADLRDLVAGMGIHHGIAKALDSKLRAALAALEADDHAGACTALQDFQNLVNAQTGKKLNAEQAEDLTDAATQIFEHICFT